MGGVLPAAAVGRVEVGSGLQDHDPVRVDARVRAVVVRADLAEADRGGDVRPLEEVARV
jgi:hypothetical protein